MIIWKRKLGLFDDKGVLLKISHANHFFVCKVSKLTDQKDAVSIIYINFRKGTSYSLYLPE